MKHAIKSVVLGLLLLLTNGSIVYAQDFVRGLEAAQRGDYAAAMKEWRPIAANGDADAQYNLGLMHETGMGVTKDYAEAAKWYRLAAAQGYADAQLNLGLMFDNGQGVTQDYKEAVRLYRLAAAQGNSSAQTNLGTLHFSGKGTTQDNVYAHMWFSIAASNGVPEAVTNRDFVAKRMTSEDISKAQDLARECVSKNYRDCGGSGYADDVREPEWNDFIGVSMLLVTVGIATLAYRNFKRRTGGLGNGT